MVKRIDARKLLTSYIGRTIKTYKGQANTIIDLENDFVLVGTARSPAGERVPIEWVQASLDRILQEEEVEISVPSLGYRSAFCGAVLLSLPGVTDKATPPRAVVGDDELLNRYAEGIELQNPG
jgi:hypothetical protein